MQMILNAICMRVEAAYGCLSDPSLSANHNASNQLSMMPTWHYFSRGTNMAMHDLTGPTCIVPSNLPALIGLGMKFCPIERFSYMNPAESIERFRKDLYTKVYYSGRDLSREELFIPQMHIPSKWEPLPFDIPPDIISRFNHFAFALRQLFKKKQRERSNLLPFQKLALKTLALRQDILIVSCDKNLGPAVIQTDTYVDMAFTDHLSSTAYREYSEDQADCHMHRTASAISEIQKGYWQTRVSLSSTSFCSF